MTLRMSFRKKLAFGFGFVLLMLSAIAITGYLSSYKMSDAADQIVSSARAQNTGMEMEWALAAYTNAVRGYLLTGDISLLQRAEARSRHFDESANEIAAMLKSADQKDALRQIQSVKMLKVADMARAVQLRQSGQTAQAMQSAFSPQADAHDAAALAAMQSLDKLGDQQVAAAVKAHDIAEEEMRSRMLLVGLLGLFCGLLCAWLIGKSITDPVQRLVTALQAIEQNDLSISDLDASSGDEMGTAARALNAMKNNLHRMVRAVAEAAEQVAQSSAAIHGNSARAATGADTQKGQVHQVATSMAEMTATVQEISGSSNQAAEAARQAAETAREGGAIVEEALQQMRGIAQAVHDTSEKVAELGTRSDQIGRIVGVIEEIAEQTNLLALNAAIEAARAGEQGRGFAVVAGEVRRLAERTGGATREINEMIGAVQSETRLVVETMRNGNEQVQRGVEVTNRAGVSLQQIIGQAGTVGEMVSQIATAATEQSAATSEVSVSMEEISRLVAFSAEEAQAATRISDSLTTAAGELQRRVRQFHLQHAGGPQERKALDLAAPGTAISQETAPAW